MIRAVTFSQRAKADLDEIWDYTCKRWSRDQANSYLDGIRQTLDLLAERPRLARLRPELVPASRVFPYRSHINLFLDQAIGIDVVRVIPARSDWLAGLSG